MLSQMHAQYCPLALRHLPSAAFRCLRRLQVYVGQGRGQKPGPPRNTVWHVADQRIVAQTVHADSLHKVLPHLNVSACCCPEHATVH